MLVVMQSSHNSYVIVVGLFAYLEKLGKTGRHVCYILDLHMIVWL